MSIRSEQQKRLMYKISMTRNKGKNERALIYEEFRYHQFGAEFTKVSLQELVVEGKLRYEVRGPKRFKTISDKEIKQTVRYYAID